jgi:predicted metalloprotease
MRWEDGRRSDNVEDRRGSGISRGVVGRGIGTVIMVLVAMYFGVDPSVVLNRASPGSGRSAIGDDRLQRNAGGTVVPDSFTHGTSAQRVRWFNSGLTSGDIKQCNTFAAKQL